VNEDLYSSFLGSHKPRTRAAYEYDLGQFASFMGLPPQAAVVKLFSLEAVEANQIVAAWTASMIESGLKDSTINRRLSALRGLGNLAMERGLSWSLVVRSVRAGGGKRDMSGPGLATVKRLIAHCDAMLPTPKNMRDVAIVRLIYGLALRSSEVASLKLADVDLEGKKLRAMCKGRAGHSEMAIPDSVGAALKDWIAIRGREPGPLFASFDPAGKGSGCLDVSSIGRIVRAIGSEIGINLWPNALRHSSITTALDLTGGNLSRVMGFTRHKTPSGPLPYDDKSDQRDDDEGDGIADLIDEGLDGGPA
jgi:integrase/recombinase XerC